LRISKSLFEAAQNDTAHFDELIRSAEKRLSPESLELLDEWPRTRERYRAADFVVSVREREFKTRLAHDSLSGTPVRKVALPRFEDDGTLLRFLCEENLPGAFPFTAGVFQFKREGEDPTRMFAGEGDAARTNRRFKQVSQGLKAHRLSTAFDSVTLYGCDPDVRPDIYGKVATPASPSPRSRT